jgi:hypothetical protein
MQNAAAIAGEVAGKSAAPDRTASIETRRKSAGSPEVGVAVDAPAALIRVGRRVQFVEGARRAGDGRGADRGGGVFGGGARLS